MGIAMTAYLCCVVLVLVHRKRQSLLDKEASNDEDLSSSNAVHRRRTI